MIPVGASRLTALTLSIVSLSSVLYYVAAGNKIVVPSDGDKNRQARVSTTVATIYKTCA